MDSKIIYITSETAKIITLRDSDSEVKIVRKSGPRHAPETLGRNHPKKFDDTEHFLEKVATTIEKDNARFLLVGPAQAKNRLKSHLEKWYPQLAAKTVGVETMDKSTDPQIMAFGRKYFAKLNRFDAI